jgi:alpha-beta hydrolase superfamily lysophospholipase
MSTVPRTSPQRETRGRPICLALEPDPVLAFLHAAPVERTTATAVLLLGPFGWQADCSYRGLRAWATSLADDGHTTARLVLPSTGDSAGGARDPDRMSVWVDAVAGAAGWLRETTGAQRVVGIGIGLGGMLTCLAASQGAAVDDLVLWAVPSRGRSMLRELRSLSQIVASEYAEEVGEDLLAPGELSLTGYLLSAQAVSELEQMTLTDTEWPDAQRRRVLLLGRDGLSADRRLQEHFERVGADVTIAEGKDYGALMENPQQSVPPADTIALTSRWLAKAPASSCGRARTPSARVPAEGEALEFTHDGVALRELPLRLAGPRADLFAVLSQPADIPCAPVCAVLLGAGALPHTGPNRGWVDLARRWAARGVPTVRIDLSGIGESDGDDPALLSDESFYYPWRTGEVLGVLDQLVARGLPERFLLGGLCSGSYQALHAALADQRIAGVLLLNLFAFSGVRSWSLSAGATACWREDCRACAGRPAAACWSPRRFTTPGRTEPGGCCRARPNASSVERPYRRWTRCATTQPRRCWCSGTTSRCTISSSVRASSIGSIGGRP